MLPRRAYHPYALIGYTSYRSAKWRLRPPFLLRINVHELEIGNGQLPITFAGN